MPSRIKTALVIAASLFMEVLDGTIITTALPTLSRDFHVASSTTSLLVSTYMLAVAIFIPLSGWLATIWQRKRLFITAVGIFAISSLLSALSPSFGFLLTMRIFQGIAGAMMVPVGRLIVLEQTEPRDLLKMISFLVWPALMAPVIAPLLGGLIVTYTTWHWIFLINVPIGIAIILIGRKTIVDDQSPKPAPFDALGFILVGLAAAGVLIASELITNAAVSKTLVIVLFIVAIAIGMFAFRHLGRVKHPLFSLEALKIPTFRVFQTGGSIFWMTIGALPYMLTLMLQTSFHWSAARAGTYVLFIFVGNIGIKPFTTPIIQKFSYRGAIVIALGLAFLATIGLAFVTPNTPAFWIMFAALVSGVGRSLALTAYNGLSFADLSREQKNSANTLSSVAQNLSQALGIGFAAAGLAGFGNLFNTASAFKWTFLILAVISLYPLFEILTLPKDAGAQATGK
ncbi:MFS transporter [Periweissella cryptocerci]|uniref:MFS transporter n=1 Tax=Periweissella cryptocerci TaxID=2506420 RepID=A0A4P6YUW2_9LACO|nr:MFS transporter [Periweissella cryptocerci]QBO36531.1 MFS transporter [Periweissella cryptocerci]